MRNIGCIMGCAYQFLLVLWQLVDTRKFLKMYGKGA